MADQVHRDLPDSELHEPKGSANADTNEVPTWNGSTTVWKKLTNDHVDSNAAILGSKLDLSNTVDTSDLKSDSVTSNKIATNAVLTDGIKIRTKSYSVDCGSNDHDMVDISSTNGSIIMWAYDPAGSEDVSVTIIRRGSTTYARVFYPSTFADTGETGTLYITYIANS